jgi:hypothetical protein
LDLRASLNKSVDAAGNPLTFGLGKATTRSKRCITPVLRITNYLNVREDAEKEVVAPLK